MERRSQRAVRTQPGSVTKPSESSAATCFPNIEELVANGGDITLGRMTPIECMATAADEHICYAMLVRRPGETVLELLQRLDRSIALASEGNTTIDEVNAPSPRPSRRR